MQTLPIPPSLHKEVERHTATALWLAPISEINIFPHSPPLPHVVRKGGTSFVVSSLPPVYQIAHRRLTLAITDKGNVEIDVSKQM